MKTFVQVSEKSQTNAVFHLATSGQLDCGDQKACKSQGFFSFSVESKKKGKQPLKSSPKQPKKQHRHISQIALLQSKHFQDMKWNDEEQVKNIAHISAAALAELKIVLHTWVKRQWESKGWTAIRGCCRCACALQDKWWKQMSFTLQSLTADNYITR